jgi:hypothetical protein
MTVTISLKEVDREFARKAKMAALRQDLTLKEFILGAVEKAIEHEETIDAIDEEVVAARIASKKRKGGKR